MGGDDGYDSLVPFETIVRKGVLLKEIDDRKQTLIEQCRANSGLTLQEVIDHNDWLLQIERDLSKARGRIERDFRISNALSSKVREGKRKAQLQQRLDVLRSQCDVLNECIHGLSDHCAWFQVSGSYREAIEYLEGHWDDEEGPSLDVHTRPDGHSEDKGQHGEHGNTHHELEGLLYSDSDLPSQSPTEKQKRRRRKKRRGGGPDLAAESRAEHSEDDEAGIVSGDAAGDHSDVPNPFQDFEWMKASGAGGGRTAAYIDVWAPD